jgi:hypothetical protein
VVLLWFFGGFIKNHKPLGNGMWFLPSLVCTVYTELIFMHICDIRRRESKTYTRDHDSTSTLVPTTVPVYRTASARYYSTRYSTTGVGEVKLLTILLYGDLCNWSLNTAPYVSTLLILQHTK